MYFLKLLAVMAMAQANNSALLVVSGMGQDDVIKVLDHAKIAEGPGGPAEMVPGQHHVRINM
jgi:branched-chain amino acid transport system substrate-binding protein